MSNKEVGALTTPHRLDDGRLFYADAQVVCWPSEMRDWIGGDQIYWRRDDMLSGYILVRNGEGDDE